MSVLSLLLHFHEILVFFHAVLTTCAICCPPVPYNCIKMRLRNLWPVYMKKYIVPYHILWVTVRFISSLTVPPWMNSLAYGMLVLLIFLPFWWVRGLIGSFLCIQSLAVLVSMKVFPELLFQSRGLWALLVSLGAYLLLFLITLPWHRRWSQY